MFASFAKESEKAYVILFCCVCFCRNSATCLFCGVFFVLRFYAILPRIILVVYVCMFPFSRTIRENQGVTSIHFWTDTILDSKVCIQRLSFLCVFTILRLHINDILVPNAPPPLLKEESLEHSWLDDALPWVYKQFKLFSSLRVYEHYKHLSSFDEALRV